jgi:hypothetical protein
MISALEWITLPLSYPFMQRALIVSVMVGAVCAVLSCYLVLKGWSLMGDAISHAVLPGIVAAYVLNLPLAVGAFVAGLACALFTGYLKENSRIKEDTVMGIVFSGMFGFGLVIFTKIETDQHLNHILFGNVLGVTWRDLIETAIVAGGTLAIVLLKRRDLLLYCFDPNHARSIGLPVRVLHYGLLILLSLTIVALPAPAVWRLHPVHRGRGERTPAREEIPVRARRSAKSDWRSQARRPARTQCRDAPDRAMRRGSARSRAGRPWPSRRDPRANRARQGRLPPGRAGRGESLQ